MRPSKYATPRLQYNFQPPKEATSGFVIIEKFRFKSRSYGSPARCGYYSKHKQYSNCLQDTLPSLVCCSLCIENVLDIIQFSGIQVIRLRIHRQNKPTDYYNPWPHEHLEIIFMTYNVSITSWAINTSHVFSETNFPYHVINFMFVFWVTYCLW